MTSAFRRPRLLALSALFVVAAVVGTLAITNDSDDSPKLADSNGVSPANRALSAIASAATPDVVQVHVMMPSMRSGVSSEALAKGATSVTTNLGRIATQLRGSGDLPPSSRVLGEILGRYAELAKAEQDAFMAGSAAPADFTAKLAAAHADWRSVMKQIGSAAKTDLLQDVPTLPGGSA